MPSAATLAGFVDGEPDRVWFGRCGCVEARNDGTRAVYVNGNVIGLYEDDDVASRDVLIAIILQRGGVKRPDVASAFGVSKATVGRVMTRLKQGGLARVADTGHTRGRTVDTRKFRERLARLFDKGLGPRAAHRAVRRLASYGTVQSLYTEWQAQRSEPDAQAIPEQLLLPLLAANDAHPLSQDLLDSKAEALDQTMLESNPKDKEELEQGTIDSENAAAGLEVDSPSGELSLDQVLLAGNGQIVQHAGSWLMLGMLTQFGLYEMAEECRDEAQQSVTLRVAVDAAAVALTLGQRCIEGVRRMQTPSMPTLLRNDGAISASWVRRSLGRFADQASFEFQAKVATTFLQRHPQEDNRVWLYVDNHMRPYTGKQVIRKGWRMQDKRAVPGCTDYYVHDEDGRPLWRISTTSHDSLCQWLEQVVDFTEIALGDDIVPCLVFDRGGAYPETMAQLRDLGAEFVTYERRKYPTLPDKRYNQKLKITLASRPKHPVVIRYTELGDKNLGSGRGRIRRIYLLMDGGEKINLLAVSTLPAEMLIRKQLARWGLQENQLKYEVERWGINQLDGRKVEPYPPDAIIPNPDRRKIEHKLKLAGIGEGEALRRLYWLDADDPKRQLAEQDRRRTVDRQKELQALRAQVPLRAPVKETTLAGKLSRHKQMYKRVLDTLRVALANAESELTVRIAKHLERPREAKKTLANLFLAPGTVRLGMRGVGVALIPAGSRSERTAFASFLRGINRLGLTLPGDPDRRPLRFRLKKGSDR